jgi:hypothetical protein
VTHIEAEYIFTESIYNPEIKVLVLIPGPWSSLKEEEVVLLTKILNAVKLSFDGIQLMEREEISLEQLSIFEPTHVLLFGTKLIPEIQYYTTITLANTTAIQSDELSNLDDTQKKNLWMALKQAFKA